MSEHNTPPSQDPYALVDADDGAEEALPFVPDGVRSRNPSLESHTPVTSPLGQAVDSNKPLPSAVAASGIPAAAVAVSQSRPPPVAAIPTLPNGEIITAKNTLQSFDSVPGQVPFPPAGTGRLGPNDGKRSSASSSNNPTSSTVPSATAVAVAIENPNHNNIVYAELAPELIPSLNVAAVDGPGNHHGAPAPPAFVWYKSKYTVFVLLGVVALLLAVVLGVVIGSTVSGGDTPTAPVAGGGAPPSPTAPTISAPTNNPMATKSPSMLPTASPITQNPTITPTLPETAEPTPSPATVRMQVLTNYINNITLSGQTISADGTSPESQALAWIITSDTTTLNTTALAMASRQEDSLAGTPIGFSMRQRYALLTMWFQQDVTLWARTDNWLIDPDECQWYGIVCDTVTENGGSRSAVTQIILNGTRSYVGAIPADIGLLSYLQHLEVKDTFDDGNSVTYVQGTLPESMGLLTQLTHLELRRNRGLSGSLPNTMGHMTALTFINVYNNSFTGPLPEGIGMWKELSHFDIDSNEMTGTLPSTIGMWTGLTNFDASKNNFTGRFPTGIENWTGMVHFHVDTNQWTGTLPVGIGLWTAVTLFTVAFNNLSGTIPSSIGNWSLIETAFFDNNAFVCTLTESICPYVNQTAGDNLIVNCDVSCTCCTAPCSEN